MEHTILAIESSCDDTSAAVIGPGGLLLSQVIASQQVHEAYGGVVPELASRAHMQNILPVVSEALRQGSINKRDLTAVAFTRGPGLLGSLLVGVSFAKGLALSLDIPTIDVNHLHAHVLAPFIRTEIDAPVPEFPYMSLLVSGGNSQIVLVRTPQDMQILGRTIDDAAGEAFDKCAKVLGLPYPGGPHIDRLAEQGHPYKFTFAKPHIPGLDYSFSGLKTSFLYTLRDRKKENPSFIEENLADLAASLQRTIIEILIDKLGKALDSHPVKALAIGGGVAANSGVRQAIQDLCHRRGIMSWIPPRIYTTDNAAMVGTAAYFKARQGDFASLDIPPFSRVTI